jgi:hypothetical protein
MQTIINICNSDCANAVKVLQRRSRIKKIIILTVIVLSSLCAQAAEVIVNNFPEIYAENKEVIKVVSLTCIAINISVFLFVVGLWVSLAKGFI